MDVEMLELFSKNSNGRSKHMPTIWDDIYDDVHQKFRELYKFDAKWLLSPDYNPELPIMSVLESRYTNGILKDGEEYWHEEGRIYHYTGPYKHNQKHGWGDLLIQKRQHKKIIEIKQKGEFLKGKKNGFIKENKKFFRFVDDQKREIMT